jgi:gas vesicle protein
MWGSNDRNEIGMIALAFLAGALVGFGVGMLVAPQSGERTRKVLKKKWGEAKDVIDDQVENVSDTFDDVRDKVRKVARKLS